MIEEFRFDWRQEQEICSLLRSFQTGSGPILFVCSGHLEVLPPGLKRPGREADHLAPSTAEVKYECSYTFTPPDLLSTRLNLPCLYSWFPVCMLFPSWTGMQCLYCSHRANSVSAGGILAGFTCLCIFIYLFIYSWLTEHYFPADHSGRAF
jgi:hypothetical protein